jgi:polyisoprenoid-binding protein YceI
MPLITGRYTLGPEQGSVTVSTGREGPAALVGHDLTLVATLWRATVKVDAEDPARSTVRATIDAASLVVREARGGPVGLTDAQRAEIEANIRAKVLRSDRHPTITFRSTAVTRDGKRWSITGNLTIRRRTRPATLRLRVARSRTPRITATTAIVQTEYGIEPFAALLGALRVKDVVEVTAEVRLPGG